MVAIVFFEALAWVYGEGVQEFLKMWGNLHWFFYHFFSVPEMLRTLFWPLKRLKESRGRGFDPEKFFEALAVNFVMRIAGFLTRFILLVIAAAAQAMVFLLCALFFAFFLGMPFFMVAGIFYGFNFIIK